MLPRVSVFCDLGQGVGAYFAIWSVYGL